MPATATRSARTATTSQIEFIGRLAAERGIAFDPEAWEIATITEASAEIERLKALPRPSQPKAEVGYYVTADGDFINVVATRDKQRTYAKKLVSYTDAGGATRWTWEYAPNVAATVADTTPLTIEQARAFGHLNGRCLKCLRPLTDITSVTAGFGKQCQKAMFG